MDRRRFITGAATVPGLILAGCIGDDDDVEDSPDDDPGDDDADDDRGDQPDDDDTADEDADDDEEDAPDIDISEVEFTGFGELDVEFTLHNNLDEEVTIDTWFIFYDGDTELEEWSRLMDVPANDTKDERIPNIIDDDLADDVTHVNVIGAIRVDDDWETPVDREYDSSILEERYENVLAINGLEITQYEFESEGNPRVDGVVENNAGESFDSAAVRVIVFDADREPVGNRMVDDTTNLDDGESWEFTVPLEDQQIDEMEDYKIELLDESPFD